MLRGLARALALRCPVCGQPEVMQSWDTPVAACPRCAYRFEREEGYWVGAMIVNLAAAMATFAVIFFAGLALFWWTGLFGSASADVPWVALTIVCLVATVGVPIWFYPRSKLVWVWLDLLVHPYSVEERDDR